MLPVYFGEAAQSFGILHPHEGRGRNASLVICQPLLGEAIWTYWALKRVAHWASGAGYDVIRFDLSGTGNSLIDPAAVSVSNWVDDIGRAADILAERCGDKPLTLLGVRLGFALAGLFSRRRDVHSLVGWDPLLDGSTWLDERKLDREERMDGCLDLQGYQLNSEMLTELSGLEVRDLDCAELSAVTTPDHEWDYPPAHLGIDVVKASDQWNWRSPVESNFYAHDSVKLLCERLA